MIKNLYMTVAITLFCSSIVVANFNTKQPIKKIKSFFSPYKSEIIDQKELSAVSINSISINNINGPITIKTGWKKKKLCLKTIKRAKKQEGIDNLDIIIDTSTNHHLAISTHQVNKKLAGSVEYELIVPAFLDVTLTISESGDVLVKNVDGNITVAANDSISIINAKKTVSAQTFKKGSILISNASGPVRAISYHGNITGETIANSFVAQTITGKVTVAYKTLPATSAVNLETTSGNICLMLPTNTNAEIHGYTAHGTVLSDHYITLKPYVTQLNNYAWNRFKKEVDGTLGSGDAHIALHSMKGNLKIMETKIT